MNWLRLPASLRGEPPLTGPALTEEERRAPWEIDSFRADVLAGLSRVQKMLPPKYFYDATGSKLFEQICEQPEYYLTRTELAILQQQAKSIANLIGPGALLVELGSGNSRKAEILLEQMDQPAGYVPVDVSQVDLDEASRRLHKRHPHLAVLPVRGDFTLSFALPPTAARSARTCVFFPGSTIGNLEPHDAVLLMRKIHRRCAPSGLFIVGVDTRKDHATLERAYNDAAGATAAFNRNMLVRIRRQLRSDIDPDSFEHLAVFNPVQARIEMHLRSRRDQTVRIEDRRFSFRRGESIITEYSYKYAPDEFAALAERAGFAPAARWCSTDDAFCIHAFSP